VTAEWFDACCVGMPLDIGILNWRGAGANPRPDGAFSRCNVPTRPAPFDSLLHVTGIRRELVNVLSQGLAPTPWRANSNDRIPSLSSLADTEVYLYYGMPARPRPTMPTPGTLTTASSIT